MTTEAVSPETTRSSRPFYTRVTLWALLVLAVAPIPHVVAQGIEGAEGFFFGIILMGVSLVAAGLIWRFQRWLLFLASLVGIWAWLSFSVNISYENDGIKTFFDFAPTVVVLGAGLVAFICGPLAFFLGRRPNPRMGATITDRGALGGLALVVVALVIVSGVAAIVGRDSVSAEEREGAFDVVEMNDTTFEPNRLEIPGDRAVQLVIENNDLIVHTFTIDDLDIDYILAGYSEKLAELPPIVAGTYEYKCKVPGHEDMKGVLVVAE